MGVGKLYLLAIGGLGICVGRMLRALGHFMLEAVEGVAHILWHGEEDCSQDIIPF